MTVMAKNWCFTLNNYSDDEFSKLESLGSSPPAGSNVRYLVFGREVGESGTPHLQGYISFTKRKTMARVKEYTSTRCHVEIAKGRPAQASDYCKKDGDFKEYGELPGGQGARNDLVALADDISKGHSLKRLAEEHPSSFIRYSTGIIRMKMMYPKAREAPPEIKVFWGKTGVGKTRRVYEFIDREQIWVHPGGSWFDGYDGQSVALFDDFDGSWFKIDYVLKLLDRYTFQVPVKGGYAWWVPKYIFITSNKKPDDWYPNANENHRQALIRRLTEFGTIQEIK